MTKSVFVLYAERFIAIALGLVSSVVLARLLTPEEIGIASLAAATATICHMLRDMGIGTYIATATEITEQQRRTCLGMAYVLSGAAAVVMLLVAYPLGIFYSEPRLVHVIVLLAIGMAMSPMVAIRSSFLNRERRYGTVSAFNVFNVTAFCVFSILFAMNGGSYLTVPLANLAAAVATSLLVGFHGGFGSLARASLKGGRQLLSVSRWPFVSMLAQSAADRSPEFTLARVQGFTASAFFEKSLTAVDLSRRLIVEALTVMLHPRLRAARSDARRFRQVCSESVTVFFAVGLSIAVVLSLVARQIVDVLFGPVWEKSGVLLETVAWVAPFSLVNYMIVQLLYYLSNPKGVAVWSILTRATFVVTVIASATQGLAVLANGLVAVEALLMLVGLFLNRRHFDWPCIGRLLAALVPAVLAGYVLARLWYLESLALHWKPFAILLSCSFVWLGGALLTLLIQRPKALIALKRSYLGGEGSQ